MSEKDTRRGEAPVWIVLPLTPAQQRIYDAWCAGMDRRPAPAADRPAYPRLLFPRSTGAR